MPPIKTPAKSNNSSLPETQHHLCLTSPPPNFGPSPNNASENDRPQTNWLNFNKTVASLELFQALSSFFLRPFAPRAAEDLGLWSQGLKNRFIIENLQECSEIITDNQKNHRTTQKVFREYLSDLGVERRKKHPDPIIYSDILGGLERQASVFFNIAADHADNMECATDLLDESLRQYAQPILNKSNRRTDQIAMDQMRLINRFSREFGDPGEGKVNGFWRKRPECQVSK